MNYSAACVALVKEFEGCKLTAYLDVRGIPTIGFGHTGNVKLGDIIDQEQADAYLEMDLNRAAAAVTACLIGTPNQNQFDAFVSFEYNTGALRGSTMQRLWNGGNAAGCADQFGRWDKATVDGKLVSLPGLTRRRAAEKALFLEETVDGTGGKPSPL